MNAPLVTDRLNKTFDGRPALRSLTLTIPAGRIVGLLGRNGAGKTTLLNLASGLLLPTDGACTTLGRASRDLDTPELVRLGVVQQEGKFLDWMTVRQHLDFTASFYPAWDRTRETRLLADLELNPKRKIAQLSPGDRQKLGIMLGVCHHPELLLLDEPVSALDPIARSQLLGFLIDLIREDGCTIVISSHLLADVEKIIDWVVFLDAGELVASTAFDELQETYAEWIVSSHDANLPPRFAEPFVLSHTGDARRARLRVRRPAADDAARFAAAHAAEIEVRPLNLDEMFPLLLPNRKN
jgi:ABC-2 type transport system ATP-binding protein